jgi:hypothetical protein
MNEFNLGAGLMRRFLVIPLVALLSTACEDTLAPLLDPPTNLTYQLEPSGDPDAPAGLLLRWEPIQSNVLEVYRVYSRRDDTDDFDLRGATTSSTFHDRGIPDLEYYIVAVDVDGEESGPSNTVRVDERLRLEAPSFLNSTSLDGAVHVTWSDNPFVAAPDGFQQYRVYSASFSLDDGLCGTNWVLEGTTVAPEFLVGALANGVPRCYAASAESIEGWESLWSPIRADTPRPDARNVLVYAFQADQTRSGFRFFQDVNGDGQIGALELGIVTDGSRTDIDFWMDRDTGGDFFFVPERVGTEVALYSNDPIEDLTSIDIAPETGFSDLAIQAVPGFGYVFQMDGGDGFARFGAIRVTHVGADFVIFDWSYQTDPGNPELSVGGGVKLFKGGVTVVTR